MKHPGFIIATAVNYVYGTDSVILNSRSCDIKTIFLGTKNYRRNKFNAARVLIAGSHLSRAVKESQNQ